MFLSFDMLFQTLQFTFFIFSFLFGFPFFIVQSHSKSSILFGTLLHIRSLCRHFQYGGLLPFPLALTSIIIMVLVPSAMSSTNRSYFICIAERGTQLRWARNLDITWWVFLVKSKYKLNIFAVPLHFTPSLIFHLTGISP